MHINADDYLREQFATNEQVRQYIAEAATVAHEENQPGLYYVALREVINGISSMSELAEGTCRSRESLYKALRIDANPMHSTIFAVERFIADVMEKREETVRTATVPIDLGLTGAMFMQNVFQRFVSYSPGKNTVGDRFKSEYCEMTFVGSEDFWGRSDVKRAQYKIYPVKNYSGHKEDDWYSGKETMQEPRKYG